MFLEQTLNIMSKPFTRNINISSYSHIFSFDGIPYMLVPFVLEIDAPIYDVIFCPFVQFFVIKIFRVNYKIRNSFVKIKEIVVFIVASNRKRLQETKIYKLIIIYLLMRMLSMAFNTFLKLKITILKWFAWNRRVKIRDWNRK